MIINVRSRTVFQRLLIRLRDLLDSISRSITIDTGAQIELSCPSCKSETRIDDLLEFGKMYEFQCDQCGSFFSVIIPAPVVRKGKLESDG